MKLSSRRSAPAMLKNLRAKFIIVNMALAALVLLVSFSTICILDHQNSVSEVEASLRKSLRNVVELPAGEHSRMLLDDMRGIADNEAENPSSVDSVPKYVDTFEPPQIGGKRGREQSDIPVAVYAYYANAHESIQMMGRSSASVNDDVLSDALEQAVLSSEESGYLRSCDLFYAKADAPMAGVTIVAFADGSLVNGWQTLAWRLFGIGIFALVVLFIFNLLFSRWALRPVSEAWSQQQQFIADASHELKTPLTVILANTSILQREKDSTIESQAQWIESTRVEAERMQSLVTDMLDLARHDAIDDTKKAADQSFEVDFSRLVEGEILTFESVAYENDIGWESIVAADLQVQGNEKQIQRLVGILFDNACKYTPKGGRVFVTLARDSQFSSLRVNNSGDAIPEEDLHHLFDRFYRMDKARTYGDEGDAPNGYGLGLSIAQQIAAAHKGTLEVSSSDHDGTTFTLRLPLA